MSSQINGIQLNNKLGTNLDMLYGHIQGNDFTPDISQMATTNSDVGVRAFRLSFQDTRTEKTPQQMKNIVTDNNVGKKLDLSI